ncbi:hypothetical protein L6V77_35085 [Myxococcota bacterium]|nr:hypothetical protein [Myxococcota bacterium]
MAKVSLQFHAAPDELLALASNWAAEHHLRMVVERFFPQTRCVMVDGTDLGSAIDHLDGVWNRIWFSKTPLVIDYSTDPPFTDEPECMALVAGNMTSDGLRESAIGAVSGDTAAMRTWRTVIKSAKSTLLSGAWVLNPASGVRQRLDVHYFTQGALALNQGGVKMLAMAGWNEFQLAPFRDDG